MWLKITVSVSVNMVTVRITIKVCITVSSHISSIPWHYLVFTTAVAYTVL